jgi:hypothetical protein
MAGGEASRRTGNFRLWRLGKANSPILPPGSVTPRNGEELESAVRTLFEMIGADVEPGPRYIDMLVNNNRVFEAQVCAVECKATLASKQLESLSRWPISADDPTNLLVVASKIRSGPAEARLLKSLPPNIEVMTYDELADFLHLWIAAREAAQEREKRSVTATITANRVGILLQIGGLSALIADRIIRLQEDRERRNDPDAISSIDVSISDYQMLAAKVAALDKAVRAYKPETDKDSKITKPFTTFKQGIANWWHLRHVEICSTAYDGAIFTGLVGVCVTAGAIAGPVAGPLAIAVPGVIMKGKTMADAVKGIFDGTKGGRREPPT